MRRLYGGLVGLALLVLASGAGAQTQGTLVVKDGNGTSQNLCQVSSATGSLQVSCSNLYVQGAQVGSGNPIPVTLGAGSSTVGAISNTGFAVTQPTAASLNATVVGTGTFAVQNTAAIPTGSNVIGSISNSSFAATQPTAANLNATVVGTGTFAVQNTAAIPTGSNVIGSISNSSFAVTQPTAASLNATVVGTGTFAVQNTAAIPTGTNTIGNVNLGTLNGAALATNQTSVQSAPGTAQTVAITVQGNASGIALPVSNASLTTIANNTSIAGQGAFTAVPAGTTNGTALGTLPANGKGARFYLGTSDTVTFTVATSAPSSAPTLVFTISGASGGTGPNWDENLSGTAMIYITATSGSPKFRWF